MDVQYKCNLEDYKEAQKAQLKRSVSYHIMLVGGGLCLLFGALLAFTGPLSSSVPLLLLAVLWLGYPSLYLPFKLNRDFQEHPNFGRDCHLQVNDDELRSQSDVSTGETKWAAFVKFHETPNLFMLYLGGRMFKVIPKRAFSASQLEEFRELLCRKLPAK
jgi:YcxB-like protein